MLTSMDGMVLIVVEGSQLRDKVRRRRLGKLMAASWRAPGCDGRLRMDQLQPGSQLAVALLAEEAVDRDGIEERREVRGFVQPQSGTTIRRSTIRRKSAPRASRPRARNHCSMKAVISNNAEGSRRDRASSTMVAAWATFAASPAARRTNAAISADIREHGRCCGRRRGKRYCRREAGTARRRSRRAVEETTLVRNRVDLRPGREDRLRSSRCPPKTTTCTATSSTRRARPDTLRRRGPTLPSVSSRSRSRAAARASPCDGKPVRTPAKPGLPTLAGASDSGGVGAQGELLDPNAMPVTWLANPPSTASRRGWPRSRRTR